MQYFIVNVIVVIATISCIIAMLYLASYSSVDTCFAG